METKLLNVLSHVKSVASSAPATDVESFLIETWLYYANELAPAFASVRESIKNARDRKDVDANISLSAAVGALCSDLTLKLETLARDSELLDAAAYDLDRGSEGSVWALAHTVAHESGDPGWLHELDAAAETFGAILRDGDSGNLSDVVRRTSSLEYICCHSFGLCLVLCAVLRAARS